MAKSKIAEPVPLETCEVEYINSDAFIDLMSVKTLGICDKDIEISIVRDLANGSTFLDVVKKSKIKITLVKSIYYISVFRVGVELYTKPFMTEKKRKQEEFNRFIDE